MSHADDVTRRTLLISGAALGAGLALPHRALAAIPPELLGNCPTLSHSATEGPYYFDPGLVRRDITEGLPGLPLRLVIRVLDNTGCLPMSNGVVEVWHAAAGGLYSGYAAQGTSGQTYLRGAQVTAPSGVASFQTVYPGWYSGRTPHIHVKVSDPSGVELLTSQVYFDDTISQWVYTHHAAYTSRGVQDTLNSRDGIYSASEELVLQWVRGEAWAGITLTV
ncbi:MAG: hypothetical protein H6733_09075 [Alphaproteobacteria bacterium]|nr:hypothetical protein [Alphaproteobacteria bacterium]